jgi:sterol desaturase/sphingolipid hydroxylase (fatty acid hydroxylase superfamily)
MPIIELKMEILKETLKQIPSSFAQSMSNYVIVVLVYLVVWKLFKKQFQGRRIQQKETANARQIKAELLNSLFSLLVGVSFVLVIYSLKSLGYTKIYTNISEYPKFFAYSGFFIFLLIDDTWFYWIHRLLHHPKIFRYVHKVHHNSIDVNPFTSLSLDSACEYVFPDVCSGAWSAANLGLFRQHQITSRL